MINKSTLEKFDLTGKTAVVTGGGTGLGYSITRALLLLGAKVLIAARREDTLRDVAEKLTRCRIPSCQGTARKTCRLSGNSQQRNLMTTL